MAKREYFKKQSPPLTNWPKTHPPILGKVSSDSFSQRDLNQSVRDGGLELRGNVRLAPELPGLLASSVLGARVIR